MNIGWLDFYYISDAEYAALQKDQAGGPHIRRTRRPLASQFFYPGLLQ